MPVKFLINSLNGGGAETLTLQLASELGHAEIFLLEDIRDYSVAEHTTVSVLNPGERPGGMGKYTAMLWQARALSRMVTPGDHLVVSLFRSFMVAWIATRFFGMKATYDCWVHNDTLRYTSTAGVKILYRKVFRTARKVVVNSRKAAMDLAEHGIAAENKIETRYNFFEAARITERSLEQPATSLVSAGQHYIVSLGRLHAGKHHDFTIRLFAGVSQAFPDLSLVIVGEGDQRNDLEELILELGLKGKVFLPGFISNPYPLLRRALVLVSCSESEGFGNVLVEALLCGTPVITSDIDSGPREILAPGSPDITYRTTVPEQTPYGWLMPAVPSDTPKALFSVWENTLLTFLSDPTSSSLPEGEVEKVAARFAKDIIVEEWLHSLNKNITSLSE